jgi:hypothetical protein
MLCFIHKGTRPVDITIVCSKKASNFLFCFSLQISRPDLFDFNRLTPRDHMGNLNHAFDLAHRQFDIAKLLDAEGELQDF